MDILLKELAVTDIMIETIKERDDKKVLDVKFMTDLDQFELIYSVVYTRMEMSLKNCVSYMGFKIKEHIISMRTTYLSDAQIEELVGSVLELMNGVIKAHNLQTRMVMSLDELNKKFESSN